MKKYITKRNMINLLGLVAFALGLAMQEDIIVCQDHVKWATFTISLIGYVTNDTLREVR